VGSYLVSSKILNGNGVKAMTGSIPAPNSGTFEIKKNTSSQIKHTKKNFEKKKFNIESPMTKHTL